MPVRQELKVSREADLTAWANLAIAELTGMPPARVELESLSGDASFRRYFRARLPSASYIVVDAPPQTEDNVAFVRIAAALSCNDQTVTSESPLILATSPLDAPGLSAM